MIIIIMIAGGEITEKMYVFFRGDEKIFIHTMYQLETFNSFPQLIDTRY